MKIKHWQGYGTVNAKKISDKNNRLVIEVSGNHEWGLYRNDDYDIYNWLVKRFNKNIESYSQIRISKIENGYKKQGDNIVEWVVYHIDYEI